MIMMRRFLQDRNTNDFILLIGLAALNFLLHLFTNNAYGFHRDELQMLDDARYLAWGYVAYPPVTPFIARAALEIFGPSMTGLRVFSSLAMSLSIFMTGLLARELGGGRRAQLISAFATAIAPIVMIQGALFQYVSFDYLWWVLIAWSVLRLLKTGDQRGWLRIGVLIGLGMMTKYTIIFFVAGIAFGVFMTPARRFLKSPWLWSGALLSLVVFLPNLIWQIQHNFISLEFLSSIHARDVDIGRTSGYLLEQFFVCANPFTLSLWVSGLLFYFRSPDGLPYRLLSWMFVVPFFLLLLFQGRSYYLAPAYPMLLAAGAFTWERAWLGKTGGQKRRSQAITAASLAAGFVMSAVLMLPITPVNSAVWNVVNEVHDNFREELGWQEMTDIVAAVFDALPAEQQATAGILTGNYGEAGAINLYGPSHNLPRAISGVNSYWLRGYGDPAPQVLIVLGYSLEDALEYFQECSVTAKITNRFNVENEESVYHPDVLVCREPRQPWPVLWSRLKRFG